MWHAMEWFAEGFDFSKVFAYGLTFSIVSTIKETVQIYGQKNYTGNM